MYCPAMKGISQASILYKFEMQCLQLHKKKSEVGWSKSCSSVDQSQILALVGAHPYPWQAWQLAGNAREGITASCCQQNLDFSLQRRSRIPVCCVLGVPGGIWDESLWTYLTSPCPGSSRDKPSSLWKNIERPPTKTSEAGRHSDMEGHHNPSQRHSPQGAIVLGMFLKLCNRRNVIWERKWENYLEAIPQ